MEYGFTGTEIGMSRRQRKSVHYLFSELTRLHHGDCVGADAEAHKLAKFLRAQVVLHPPTNQKARAFCKLTEMDISRPPRAYLHRNKAIAAEGVDGLIATPKEFVEILRSGTWSTIRYARKLVRPIWIVYPDGSIKVENDVQHHARQARLL